MCVCVCGGGEGGGYELCTRNRIHCHHHIPLLEKNDPCTACCLCVLHDKPHTGGGEAWYGGLGATHRLPSVCSMSSHTTSVGIPASLSLSLTSLTSVSSL
jgi:hypothetical protein